MDATVYIEGIAVNTSQPGIIVIFHNIPDGDLFHYYDALETKAMAVLEEHVDSKVMLVRFFVKELGDVFPFNNCSTLEREWEDTNPVITRELDESRRDEDV